MHISSHIYWIFSVGIPQRDAFAFHMHTCIQTCNSPTHRMTGCNHIDARGKDRDAATHTKFVTSEKYVCPDILLSLDMNIALDMEAQGKNHKGTRPHIGSMIRSTYCTWFWHSPVHVHTCIVYLYMHTHWKHVLHMNLAQSCACAYLHSLPIHAHTLEARTAHEFGTVLACAYLHSPPWREEARDCIWHLLSARLATILEGALQPFQHTRNLLPAMKIHGMLVSCAYWCNNKLVGLICSVHIEFMRMSPPHHAKTWGEKNAFITFTWWTWASTVYKC